MSEQMSRLAAAFDLARQDPATEVALLREWIAYVCRARRQEDHPDPSRRYGGREIARRAGVHVATVSRFETGVSNAPTSLWDLVAAYASLQDEPVLRLWKEALDGALSGERPSTGALEWPT